MCLNQLIKLCKFIANNLAKAIKNIMPTPVKKGQIWQYVTNKGNPYVESKEINYEVLDVKDGFVKYKNLSNGRIETEKIYWFTYQSKCIQNIDGL